MRRAAIVLALIASVSWAAFPAQAQDAIVPDDFPTISAAVAGVTDVDGSGDLEIFVRAGTYAEVVSIVRSNLSLTGEDPATTTIEGPGTIDTVRVRARQGVSIGGFTVVASGLRDSIAARRTSGLRVQGNILTGGGSGVRLVGGGSAQILDNEIFGTTEEAIKADRARNLMVMGNVIHDNAGEGIDLRRSSRSRVQGNTVMNNASNGLRDRGGVDSAFIGNQSLSNGDNGFLVRDSTGILLEGNTASGNVSNGLRMRDTSGSLVTVNAFTGNTEWGVRRESWQNDDFDASLPGVQDPAGDNDLSGNVNGELRED